jgi:hypothetical protein
LGGSQKKLLLLGKNDLKNNSLKTTVELAAGGNTIEGVKRNISRICKFDKRKARGFFHELSKQTSFYYNLAKQIFPKNNSVFNPII